MKNVTEDLSWAIYAPPIIDALNLKGTAKGEWYGPCPNCGGKERFQINEFKRELKHNCHQECDLKERTKRFEDLGLLKGFTQNEPLPKTEKCPSSRSQTQWISCSYQPY